MHLDRPLVLRAGGLGVAAGLVAVVGQFLPVLLDGWSATRIGPVTFAVGVASLLVSPVLVLVLGHRAGTRRNVAREYDTVALSLAVGGAFGYLVGYAAGYLGLSPGILTSPLAFMLAGTTWNAVVKGGWFAVAGVAGASVAHFRAAERNP